MVDLVTLSIFVATGALVWLLARKVIGFVQDPLGRRLALASAGESYVAAPPGSAASDLNELDRDLRRAGYYRPGARGELFDLRNVLLLTALVVTGLTAFVIGSSRQDLMFCILVIGLLAAAALWGLPRVLIAMQARWRVARVLRGMPDALDIILMCLRGGLPLQQALAHVSREMSGAHADLALELSIIRQHAEMNSIEFALQQFAARIDGVDTTTLASLVAQHQRLGTGLADSLEEYVTDFRAKRRHAAEERAGRSQLALLLPVTLCLVPSVLLLLLGPAAMELWKFLQGLQGPVSTGL